MEKFFESAVPGLFDDIFTAIYNDDKQAPSSKRAKLSLVSIWLYLSYLSCQSYEKNSLDRYNFMETSRTNAQYKRNDRYNLLYEIE